MIFRTPSPRTPRASCRVGCVLAALLVTLGGVRLLVAAESTKVVDMARPAIVRAAVSTPPASSADLGAYGTTIAEFTATVEHTSRRMECIPGGCGFPRVRPLDEGVLAWTALAKRVVAATLPTFAVEDALEMRPSPVAWVPGSTCGLACPEQLHTPGALTSTF